MYYFFLFFCYFLGLFIPSLFRHVDIAIRMVPRQGAALNLVELRIILNVGWKLIYNLFINIHLSK